MCLNGIEFFDVSFFEDLDGFLTVDKVLERPFRDGLSVGRFGMILVIEGVLTIGLRSFGHEYE